MSPGTRNPNGWMRTRMHRDLGAVDFDVDAAHPQHPLGVIASRQRFDDRGRPSAAEPGEQDRRFHLRARHRAFARSRRRRQPVPAHAKRCSARRRCVHELAPMARSGSAMRRHRPPAQRLVAVERASMSVPASTPASSCMVVPELPQSSAPSGAASCADAGAVQRVPVGRKIAHPDAAGAQRMLRCRARPRRRCVADVGASLCQRAKDERTVADRLVAGDEHLAVDACRRDDALLGHADRAGSLPIMARRKRSAAASASSPAVSADAVEQRRSDHGSLGMPLQRREVLVGRESEAERARNRCQQAHRIEQSQRIARRCRAARP